MVSGIPVEVRVHHGGPDTPQSAQLAWVEDRVLHASQKRSRRAYVGSNGRLDEERAAERTSSRDHHKI